ncbi:PREDICTED: cell wall protein DAN4-like [Dufourea novaeangliae]|uniref:cell wall protein DAN4-like n=1 Tax=Dufourea novaeangliae TaxID=178035 RepID=UPI0007671581|nr:PREDICTED: cell wall protein DAN4-like [Dufourea novaeangliae]
MGGHGINIHRGTNIWTNMFNKYKPLMQCYVCPPGEDSDCTKVQDSQVKECTPDIMPSTPTSPTSETSPTSPTSETSPTSPTSETSPTGPTSETSSTGPTSGTSPTGPTSETSSTGPTSGTSSTGPTSGTSSTGPTSGTSPTSPTSETSSAGPVPTSAPARERRSVLDRFSRRQPFEADDVYCFTRKVNDTVVARGCGNKDMQCTDGECVKCTTDKCNSASSTTVFTSMIMFVVVAIFMTN